MLVYPGSSLRSTALLEPGFFRTLMLSASRSRRFRFLAMLSRVAWSTACADDDIPNVTPAPPAALTTGSGCAHLLIRVVAHSFGIPRVPSQHCVTSQNDFRGTLRKQNKSTLLTGASALAQPRGIAFTPARSRAADTKRRRDVRNDRQGRCLAKMWHARHAHTQTTAAESARTLAFLNGTSG